MVLHKITASVGNNKWFKRLDTQLNEPTNKNLVNVFIQRRHYFKTLGTIVINRPISPLGFKFKKGLGGGNIFVNEISKIHLFKNLKI